MPTFDMTKVETGDVIINKMMMTSLTGQTYGILAQVESFSIFEDISKPVLFADIHLIDGLNIIKRFPIIGKEFIDIDFQTPGRDKSYTARLFVYSVTNLIINSENQEQKYTLKCCSEEFLWDCQTTVEKGYKLPIDQIITDIMTVNLIGKCSIQKQMYFDVTQGVQHIVPPRISPFSVIEMLKTRAKSTRLSSSWVFYEDRHGFHFTTIEDMYVRGLAASNKTYYKQTALRAQLQGAWEHWDIVDYHVNQQFNILDAIKTGSYNAKLESFQLHSKELDKWTFKSGQGQQSITVNTSQGPAIMQNQGQGFGFDSFISLGSSGPDHIRSMPDANLARYGKDNGIIYFEFADETRPPTFIEQFLPPKFAFMTPNLTSTIDLYLNGDTTLGIGDVIKVFIPKPDKLTDTAADSSDFLTNGYYMILSMRHNILISELKPKYTIVVTVCSGVYINNSPGISGGPASVSPTT
jgi:hypothetical protein